MNSFFAASFFSERLLQTISWTLLHSLWQGLAMALFAGLIMLISKRQKAQLRYNLLSVLMLAFVVGISTTALIEWHFFKSLAHIPSIQYLSASEVSGGILNETQMLQARSWFKTNVQLLRSLFEQNHLLFVGVWILMLSLKSIKMGLDIWSLYRMRWYRTYQPSLYWRNRLIDLAPQSKAKQ
ncbi:MAG: hypothetical protein SFV55_22450, partial [Haliscomenobacter sp.]|uniref:hypothetical protein n=1 Tax=Haliscomenobacter sp. TaxID=2717303 RepID=UPI0029ACD326